jgi:hypothetical protein
MPAGDFADLQLQLARLASRQTTADLDEDLDLAKQVINETYLGCFLLPDGTRPSWARRTLSLFFQAPITVTLQVTQGSQAVSGHEFDFDQIGSAVRIDGKTYTYAGDFDGRHNLVEHIECASGTVQAVVYHNSQPLPVSTIDVVGNPELIDKGLLYPMSGREAQARYRQSPSQDFFPTPGAGTAQAGLSRSIAFETGEPLFYYIESSALAPESEALHRLVIDPAPNRAVSVKVTGTVTPAELVDDFERPVLVGDLVTRILLPIARHRFASVCKSVILEQAQRQGLAESAARAESLLATLSTPQRRGSGRAISIT